MSKEEAQAPIVDRSVIAFAAAALIAGIACLWLRGAEGVWRALDMAVTTLVQVAPQVCGGALIAGLVQVLIPRDVIQRWLGAETGMRGLLIAEVAGALTPGGPFGSFALVYALGKIGADIGVLICYLTSWTTISLMRVLIWEIPFLGAPFTVVRFVVSLPMGIVAGLLARRLAQRWGWRTETIVR